MLFYFMFDDFMRLLNTKELVNTVADGDCFFDTLHKITGLYTRREWRTLLAKRMYHKGVFTLKRYKEYIRSKEWADYDVVYEAIRVIHQPVCLVQYEHPNTVMLIRPDGREWSKDVLYIVYYNGKHFTTFVRPITPPVLIPRFKSLEKDGMREDVEGLTVTHGGLNSLLYDGTSLNASIPMSNIEELIKKYESSSPKTRSRPVPKTRSKAGSMVRPTTRKTKTGMRNASRQNRPKPRPRSVRKKP
jgi:hypothetical protein